MVHDLQSHTLPDVRQPGERLFQVKQRTTLKSLRRYLTLHFVPHSNEFTWKAIRRGRVFDAQTTYGVSIEAIKEMGQWRSNAWTKYSDPDVLDAVLDQRSPMKRQKRDAESRQSDSASSSSESSSSDESDDD